MPVYTTSNIKNPNTDIASKQFSTTSRIFEKYKFRYFIPIISNPEALKKIFDANKSTEQDQKNIESGIKFTTIEKLSEAFQSTTIKARTTLELIEDYYDIPGIKEYFKITYLDHAKIKEKFRSIITTNNQNINIECCNNNNVVDMIYTPLKNSQNTALSDASKKNRATGINEFEGASKFHNKSTPGLSVIQILDPDLRACLKHSQETSVFFNLINTLDMSMAIPYVNIKFIIPSKYTQNSQDSTTSRDYFVASFNNFFFGSSKDISTDPNEKYTKVAKAINGDYYIDKYVYAKAIPAESTQAGAKSTNTVRAGSGDQTDTSVFNYIETQVERKEVDISMFTMPQSLVNGDEKIFGDYNAFTEDELKVRQQPIHDKFRPFMSIENIDFDVRPTKELMSFKTATINMVLYDKSRLNEVLAFVKPDLFGSFGSEIILQYGWQHTLGDPEYTAANEMSPIAEFINSLKCYEKYQIINSSYSIQENGQVNITLNISMKGPSEMRGTPVNKDISSFALNNSINSAISMIKAASFSDTKGNVYIEGKNLTLSNDKLTDDTLNNLSKEVKDVYEVAKKNMPPAVHPRLSKHQKDLENKITELRTHVKSSSAQINQVLRNGLLSFLETNDDPFLDTKQYKNNTTEWTGFNTQNNLISLGKVLTGLLGKLIVTTYQYDEVQIVFFNLNEKAARARCLNIAAIPIDKKEFEKWFISIMQNSSQISIEGLVGLVLRRYVNEKASALYGLNQWLKLTENSETKYIFEHQQKNSNNTLDKNQVNQANAAILDEIRKQYYGQSAESKGSADSDFYDLTFKLPLVKMTFDTMIHEVSDRTTLLRINFYDEHDNPFESMFDLLGNFQNKDLKKAISTINYLVNNHDGMTQENFKNYKKRTIDTINSLFAKNIIQAYNKDNQLQKDFRITDFDQLKEQKIRIMTTNEIDQKKNFMSLKSMFKELLPSITFGAPNSAAISANVSSMNDPKLSTVFMTRDEQNSSKSAQYQMFENQNLMPTRIIPSQVSAKIIGCPIVHFGQMLFFDFNTNTTVDNAYVITGIKHSISPGKFETDLTLSLADGYARFLASSSTIKQFLEIAKQLKDDEENKAELQAKVNTDAIVVAAQREQAIEKILNTTGKYLLRFSINRK